MNNHIGFDTLTGKAVNKDLPFPDDTFVDQLFLQITSVGRRPEKKLRPRFSKRLVWASVIATLLILFFAIGPQQILLAFQEFLQFIPGVGFEEPIYELAEPVVVERDGLFLSIDQVISTDDETIVYFTGHGFDGSMGALDEEIDWTETRPRLIFPDGTIRRGQAGTIHVNDQNGEFSGTIVFNPIPNQMYEFSLIFPRFLYYYSWDIPVDWVIDLRLEEAVNNGIPVENPNFVVSVGEDSPVYSEGLNNRKSLNRYLQDQIILEINAVTSFQDELFVSLSIYWEDPQWHVSFPFGTTLIDAQGEEYPMGVMIRPNLDYFETQENIILRAHLEDGGLDYPITIQIESLTVRIENFYPSQEQVFDIQLPENLSPGDCFEHAGSVFLERIPISLDQICMVSPEDLCEEYEDQSFAGPQPQVAFEFSVNPGVEGVQILQIEDEACFPDSSNCSRRLCAEFSSNQEYPFQWALMYYQLPARNLEINVQHLEIEVPGPWEIQFDLPDNE